MPAQLDPSSVHVEARCAPRFSIEAPVRFRTHGSAWLEGTTVNISRAGLLLRTAHEPPPPQTLVELQMALAAPGTRGCAHVACVGQVVRVEPAPVAGETFMAATIEKFQIEPAGRHEEQMTELRVVE